MLFIFKIIIHLKAIIINKNNKNNKHITIINQRKKLFKSNQKIIIKTVFRKLKKN